MESDQGEDSSSSGEGSTLNRQSSVTLFQLCQRIVDELWRRKGMSLDKNSSLSKKKIVDMFFKAAVARGVVHRIGLPQLAQRISVALPRLLPPPPQLQKPSMRVALAPKRKKVALAPKRKRVALAANGECKKMSKRMVMNRESASLSRKRDQAYNLMLEKQIARLKVEIESLKRERIDGSEDLCDRSSSED